MYVDQQRQVLHVPMYRSPATATTNRRFGGSFWNSIYEDSLVTIFEGLINFIEGLILHLINRVAIRMIWVNLLSYKKGSLSFKEWKSLLIIKI